MWAELKKLVLLFHTPVITERYYYLSLSNMSFYRLYLFSGYIEYSPMFMAILAQNNPYFFWLWKTSHMGFLCFWLVVVIKQEHVQICGILKFWSHSCSSFKWYYILKSYFRKTSMIRTLRMSFYTSLLIQIKLSVYFTVFFKSSFIIFMQLSVSWHLRYRDWLFLLKSVEVVDTISRSSSVNQR